MLDKKQRLADEAAAAAMARSGLGGHQRIEPEKVPEVVVWGDLLDLMIDHMSPSSLQADIKYLRYKKLPYDSTVFSWVRELPEQTEIKLNSPTNFDLAHAVMTASFGRRSTRGGR